MKYLFILILFTSSAQAQYVEVARPYDSTVKYVYALALEPFRIITSDTPKCKHIYVAVEQSEVRVSYPIGWTTLEYKPPLSGRHEGKELVCIKCFHLRKQIIDYGKPLWNIPGVIVVDTLQIKK